MQKTSSASKLNAQLKFGAYLSGRPPPSGRVRCRSCSHPQRLDIELLPPCEFISALVKLTMMKPAERHGEFVTYFASERALLSKSEVVRIRRAATAGQTGLGAHELQMVRIAQSKLFAKRGDGLLSSFGWCVLD
jgi:hypothetical protein